MTTPIASVALTYGGTDLQPEELGFHLQIASGLDDSPDVRGDDVLIPYLPGKLPRPRRFDHRRIVLEGMVRGLGTTEAERRSDYRATRRGLAVLFDPAAVPADLVATLEDGYTATIACRALTL